MQYRIDNRSGNELSILGFGCMRFPGTFGKADQAAVSALVKSAIEQGVNYFDTAYMYPGSEAALGTALKELNARDQVFIADKLPHMKVKTVADAQRMFDTMLERLQTDRIDYLLMHNVTRFEQWQRMVEIGLPAWLQQLRDAGKVKQVGFSFHGPFAEFEPLLDAYAWDFVQIQYNYVNENYQAGRTGLRMAAERGLPVIIMEPLLGGKLADSLPKGAARILQAADPQASNASWGLRWLWDQPEVSVVLSGMNAQAQLDDNCAIANNAVPGCLSADQHEVIARTRAEFERTNKVPCTGCNYCMPCPAGINIPAVFAAYNQSYSFGWFSGVFAYATSAGMSSSELHMATDCIGCGACEKKCPQAIAIRQNLKDAARRLQPPGMKAAARLYAKMK